MERFDPAIVRVGCAGVLASLTVVAGGLLAGAGGPGSASAVGWTVPAIPVEPRGDLLLALVLFYGGMLALVWLWFVLRRHVVDHGASIAAVVVVAAVWALPFALGPPLGSRDVYAYAAQGELADAGFDVYVNGPGALVDHPSLEAVDPLYRESPVVYGPVFVAVSSGITAITDGPLSTVLVFRGLAIVGIIISGIAIVDLARRYERDPADALVMSVGSPLVMLHLVSGAHNESIMAALLLAGVAIGTRPGASGVARTIGISLCAVAGTIKVPAVLGSVFVAWPWIVAAADSQRRAIRFVMSAGLALGVVALAGQVTGWGFGWVEAILATEPVDAYLSVTRIVGGIVQFATGSDLDVVLEVVRLAALLVAAAVVAWVLKDGRYVSPLGLGWCLVLATFIHPTTQPWYLLWGVFLIAAVSGGQRNRVMLALMALACFGVPPTGPHLARSLIDDGRSLLLGLASAGLALGYVLLMRHELIVRPAPGEVANTQRNERDEQPITSG